MKTLTTLILSGSLLLTACGQDSKSNSSTSPAQNKPVVAQEKKDPSAPVLDKVANSDSAQPEAAAVAQVATTEAAGAKTEVIVTKTEAAPKAEPSLPMTAAGAKPEVILPRAAAVGPAPVTPLVFLPAKSAAPKATVSKAEPKAESKVDVIIPRDAAMGPAPVMPLIFLPAKSAAPKATVSKAEPKAEPKVDVIIPRDAAMGPAPVMPLIFLPAKSAHTKAPTKHHAPTVTHAKVQPKGHPKSSAKSESKAPAKAQVPTTAPVAQESSQAQAPAAQTDVPCANPCGTGNIKASQPEFSGLEVTGLAATPDQSYITLVNDGLMTAVRREVTRGGEERVRANSKLAQSILDGRMFIDSANGDRVVTVMVSEGNRVQTYNFRVTGYTNRLMPMHLVAAGPTSHTTGNRDLNASLACLDTCGKCEVAVLKLETNSRGASAKAYAIIRSSAADLKFRLNHANTKNADVLDFRRFFVNSDLRSSAEERLERAKLETFEVAYGVAMVRTLLVGVKGEMLSQVSPLVHSTQGALNHKMRLTDRNSDSLDISDLENRSTYLSAKMALARLIQVDGNGGLTVNYLTKRLSSSDDGDGFSVKFKTRSTAVYPMTGALLQ